MRIALLAALVLVAVAAVSAQGYGDGKGIIMSLLCCSEPTYVYFACIVFELPSNVFIYGVCKNGT